MINLSKKFKFQVAFIVASLTTFCPKSTQADNNIDIIQEVKSGSPKGLEYKQVLSSYLTPERNAFCKNKHAFCPTTCSYDPSVSLAYFLGDSTEQSKIPSMPAQTYQEFRNWYDQEKHNPNSYLVAYKPGCPPCAQLLAALESTAKSHQEAGIVIHKMNTKDPQQVELLHQANLEFTGTPTIWKLSGDIPTELPLQDVPKTLIEQHQPVHISWAHKSSQQNQSIWQTMQTKINALTDQVQSMSSAQKYGVACLLIASGIAAIYVISKKHKKIKTKDESETDLN